MQSSHTIKTRYIHILKQAKPSETFKPHCLRTDVRPKYRIRITTHNDSRCKCIHYINEENITKQDMGYALFYLAHVLHALCIYTQDKLSETERYKCLMCSNLYLPNNLCITSITQHIIQHRLCPRCFASVRV